MLSTAESALKVTGGAWWPADKPQPEDDAERDSHRESDKAEFPNMKDKQKVTFGKRSGLLIIGMPE